MLKEKLLLGQYYPAESPEFRMTTLGKEGGHA